MCVSKPKIPTPTPVVERQAYKNAPSRGSLSTGDSEARRRLIAGVATSAQGVAGPASTTKRVMAGGDTPMGAVLGGAPSIGAIAVDAPSLTPERGAQRNRPNAGPIGAMTARSLRPRMQQAY